MGREIDESLVSLKQNAEELRNLGKEWGFSESEITACIEEALSQTKNQDELKKTPKNKARLVWGYIRFLLKIPIYCFIAICVLCIGFTVLSYHEPTEKYLSQTLQPFSYQLLRLVRLAAVPIHSIANVTKYYDAECLVENPFFEEAPIDCVACKAFKKVKDVNASDFSEAKFSAYVNAFKPVVLRKTIEKNVTYRDLRSLYLENREGFDEMVYGFDSTDPSIYTPGDLLLDDKEELVNTSQTLQIHWESRTVIPSAAFRKLFPRPTFMPENTEIGLQKNIFIDGPNTPTYGMPGTIFKPSLYILGSGKRRVLVRPLHCKNICNSMLVFMEAGDSLMFNHELWDLFIAANGDQPSLGYLLTFTQ